ncbi:MAG: biotin/lipoyl-containing protein [Bacteroidales bacterium]
MAAKSPKAGVLNEYIAICNEKGCKFQFNFMDDHTIRLGKKGSGLTFVIDEDGYSWVESKGERYIAEIVEKNQNRYHILINGNSYQFSIETPFSFKRKKFLSKLTKGSKHTRIPSPMPGKIVEILVNEGDKVTAGDPVLILEAMKMQNEIQASIPGIISSISVKQGQTVMKDEILFEIVKG